jgi:hypothetical protein
MAVPYRPGRVDAWWNTGAVITIVASVVYGTTWWMWTPPWFDRWLPTACAVAVVYMAAWLGRLLLPESDVDRAERYAAEIQDRRMRDLREHYLGHTDLR